MGSCINFDVKLTTAHRIQGIGRLCHKKVKGYSEQWSLFENMTLPRTFLGRSEVGPVSFKNTDLSVAQTHENSLLLAPPIDRRPRPSEGVTPVMGVAVKP